jgi:hypothetical protein
MAGNRSPNYPAVGLPEAVEVIGKLHKAERRSTMTAEDAARAMGYNALHGPARSRLSALRKYGLLDEVQGGGFRLSDTAMTVLFPPSDEERAGVLKDAAFRPELFRELASQSDASDSNLVGRLVRQGFTPAGARAAVAAFRSTFSLAPAEEEVYDPDESEDEDVIQYTPPPPGSRRSGGGQPEAQSFIFPLADGIVAKLSLTGGTLTKQGVEMLGKYLTLAKDAVPDGEATIAAIPADAPSSEPEPQAEQFPDGAPD